MFVFTKEEKNVNIKKLFINLLVVLFVLVVIISVVTVIKQRNQPKDDYVIQDNTQLETLEQVSEDSEVEELIESTQMTETEEVLEAESTRTMYVQGSVNVRSGAGVTYPLVGNLAVNAEVTAIGEAEGGWQKILYRDAEAFVSEEYLGETPVEVTSEPAENAEQTPPPQAETPPTSEAVPTPETTPTPEVTPPPENTPPEAPPEQVPESVPEPEVTPTPEPTPEEIPTPEEPAPSAVLSATFLLVFFV